MSLTLPTRAEPRQGTSAARARRPGSGEPTAYDFRRPIQLSREHQRILQVGFDGFARQATTVFTSALRSICQVTLTNIDQRSYAEYVDSLTPPAPARTETGRGNHRVEEDRYLTLFTTDPMPGRGVLALPLAAVMSCVDHMLGGPGDHRQPLRQLTEIETGVISGLIDRLLAEMRYSLTPIVALEPEVTGVEYSPQFAQVAGAADVVVVIELDLRIDDYSHQMSICLPFNGLHPHLNAAAAPAPVSSRERAQRAEAAALLHETFATVPVDVQVRFRATRVDPAALSGLRLGDVLRLSHPASAPLDVTVDDQAFAHATAGAQGQRLAALIVATSPSVTGNVPGSAASSTPSAIPSSFQEIR